MPTDAEPDISDEEIAREVTALLFASPEPLTVARLAEALGGVEKTRVDGALEEVGRRVEKARLPMEVRAVQGGYTLRTTPDVAETLTRLVKGKSVDRVSPAALETLAVIAYRQPVTKAEVEAIRGVQAGPVLRSLVDRGLVKVVGRSEDPGRALQYGTTPEFLDRFGLVSLEELPRDAELARG
jgi:segregation and condensation protein B